jgi:hypothetical protein
LQQTPKFHIESVWFICFFKGLANLIDPLENSIMKWYFTKLLDLLLNYIKNLFKVYSFSFVFDFSSKLITKWTLLWIISWFLSYLVAIRLFVDTIFSDNIFLDTIHRRYKTKKRHYGHLHNCLCKCKQIIRKEAIFVQKMLLLFSKLLVKLKKRVCNPFNPWCIFISKIANFDHF